MTEQTPEVEDFDSTVYSIGEVEVAWVTTQDGPVRLGQGDPLPEGVHPDEVARLANGGVLADLEQAPSLGNGIVEDGTVDEIKVRVGTDAERAQAYLDAELAADKPRGTLVSHLEGVIAATEDDGPVVSADAGPGAVAVVEDA